jgi:hypothetical protein
LNSPVRNRGIRVTQRAGFIRGGNWNNGSNAGVETLNLNNTPGNTNNNIGFRCVRYSSIFNNWPEQGIYGFLLRLRTERGTGYYPHLIERPVARSAPRRLLPLFLLSAGISPDRENIKSLPLACRCDATPNEFVLRNSASHMRHRSAGKGHLLSHDRPIRPDRRV